MSAQPPQVVRPFQKQLFASLFILTFFFFSVFAFAEPAWALGVRASFQGGFLHLEWDAAPAGATDWRVQVYSPNSDLFNGNLLICGPGVVGIGPCPFGIGTTSANIDLTQTLLSGRLIGGITVIASIEALDGGPVDSGVFVGTIPTPPILLEKASGDGQSDMVNTLLEEPLVVRFTRFGQPLQTVFGLSWSVTAPSAATGYLVEASAVPVGPGERAVGFRLGDKEGEYLIQGTCSHVCGEGRQGDSVTFTARATKKLKLEVISGRGQSGPIGTPLPRLLVVKVVDAQGRGVSGQSVTFTIAEQPSGARAASPQSSITKSTGGDGTASATLTLGDKIGQYTVEVRCAECTEGLPQTFTATAVGPEGCTLNGASIASQVNFASGNLFYTQTILSMSGSGPQVGLTLAYNSVDATSGPLGAHWTHPYAMKIVRDSDGFITLMEEDGYRVVFEETSSGFYAPIDHFGRPGTGLEKLSNGSYRLRRKGGTEYRFDPAGHLTQVQDRNGNALTLHYQGENLTELVDASGRVTRLSYDAQGRIASVEDPAGRMTTLIYEAGFLTEILDPTGRTTTFSYDASGRMLRRVDPDGNPVEYTYDAEGRMIQVVDVSGVPVTVTYQPEIHQATVTDREGGVTTYIYDPELDVPVQTIAPDGGVTLNTYDPERNLLSTTDPAGNSTAYSYDAAGNALTMTDAAGRVTRYTYEPLFNQMASITDPEGGVTSYEYDTNGNLLALTDPTGAITRYEYDAAGKMIRLTNPLGQITSFAYDVAGNLTTITDPTGAVTAMVYDAIGNLIQRTDATGATTHFEYDANNRLIKVTDPLGNATQFSYDGRGNRIAQTDSLGRTTRYAYNHLNKLTQVINPLNQATTYAYDTRGNLVSITDAKGQTTSYTYDLLDRLLSENDPLGNTIQYVYDSRGNLVSKTDAENQTTTFSYDALNRLIGKTFPDNTVETFSYDANGRVLTASNPAIGYQFSYDVAGRVMHISDSRGYTVRYEYDAAGNRTRLIYPDGRAVHYHYDEANRLATLTNWNGRNVSFKYDALGRRTVLFFPNGASARYNYDAANQLLSLTHQTSSGNILDRFEYTYDTIGNRLSVIRPDEKIAYTYDFLDRLIQATPTKLNGRDREHLQKAETFTYDPVGNRLSGPEGKDSYFYNPANQLTNDRKHQYRYDRNGNLIQKIEIDDDGEEKRWSYAYDAQNRLLQVIKQEEGEAVTVTFRYDPFGKRIEKKVEETEHGKSEIKVYTYVYDNEDILLEYLTKSEGRESRTETTRYLHGPGVDEPLEIEQKGRTYFYHADALGSVSTLTDERQKDVQSYEYTSFGELKHRGNNVKQSYTYTGREWDEEMGMHFYRARYYDAKIGRFLTKDPLLQKFIRNAESQQPQTSALLTRIHDPRGLHSYVYVRNNPIKLTDPSGMIEVEALIRELRGQVIEQIYDMIIDTTIAGVAGATCASRYCRRRIIPDERNAFAECLSIFEDAGVLPGTGYSSANLALSCQDECVRISRQPEFREICGCCRNR
jgi:RHS repeat-associated protein